MEVAEPMLVMRIRTAFVIAALCGGAQAGTWGLQVHGLSYSFAERQPAPWTSVNDGFALRYAFDASYSVQVGHYRNQQTVQGFNFFTNYGVLDYTPWQKGSLRGGLFAGAQSGFDGYLLQMKDGLPRITELQKYGVEPVIGLLARYQPGRFNVTLRFMPGTESGLPATLMGEIGLSF